MQLTLASELLNRTPYCSGYWVGLFLLSVERNLNDFCIYSKRYTDYRHPATATLSVMTLKLFSWNTVSRVWGIPISSRHMWILKANPSDSDLKRYIWWMVGIKGGQREGSSLHVTDALCQFHALSWLGAAQGPWLATPSRKELMEIYLKNKVGVTANSGCRRCGKIPEAQTEGRKAVQLLGWEPGLRIIVIVNELIIIWDRLLISKTLEVAADKP